MAVNYSRVYLIGSIFALVPTLLFFLAVGRKPEALVIFIPFAILFARLCLWVNTRAVKENADDIRRRYKADRVLLGK